MGNTPNLHEIVLEAVRNFKKLYEKSVVSAGVFNDSGLVIVDCHLSTKRLVIVSTPKLHGKVGVGLGSKLADVLSEVIEFDTKTFSSVDVLKIMEDNFDK